MNPNNTQFSESDKLDVVKDALQWVRDVRADEMKDERSTLEYALRREQPAEKVFIAETSSMKETLQLLSTYAATDLPLLILGERGTGKTHAARTVHLLSRRKNHLDVLIDCAFVRQGELLASIFGEARSIHSDTPQLGAVESALGGTLIIKHVEDASHEIQERITEVIESNRYRHKNGHIPHPCNVRVVLTSRISLDRFPKQSTLIESLHRLVRKNVVSLPPLTERREEIASLVSHFLKRASRQTEYQLEPSAGELLAEHHWAGNLRELQLIIERCVIVADDRIITRSLVERVLGEPPLDLLAAHGGDAGAESLTSSLKSLRENHIRAVFASVNGNRATASNILGITTRTLHEKIKELHLH